MSLGLGNGDMIRNARNKAGYDGVHLGPVWSDVLAVRSPCYTSISFCYRCAHKGDKRGMSRTCCLGSGIDRPEMCFSKDVGFGN